MAVPRWEWGGPMGVGRWWWVEGGWEMGVGRWWWVDGGG